MDNLNDIISSNLKQIREEKKLSLDKVAGMTGVSKSMLGQIERGESNPTISTLWKIALGLKVSFTHLLQISQPDNVVRRREELKPLCEDNGKYRAYPLFPYDDSQQLEVFMIEMDAGAYLSAEGHGEDTFEIITVFDGELTLKIENNEYVLHMGDGIKFKANLGHTYHNTSKELTRFNIVINY